MNSFVNGMTPKTANGAATLGTSSDVFVDLFANIGSSRNNPADVVRLFKIALVEDWQLAFRILLWARDCRGGAGERKIFEQCVLMIMRDPFIDFTLNDDEMFNLFEKISEIGRYDDFFPFVENGSTRQLTVAYLMHKLSDPATSGLVAKWLPREKSANKNIAKLIMKTLGLASKEYREMIVALTNVVEQKMCAKQFDQIVYEHVPSLAMTRYGKAFGRNDPARFAEYKAKIASGEVKAKATSLFPHDLVRSVYAEPEMANSQWKELANYIPDGVSILPLVDVSGSMQCPASGSVTCMDVSIALGLYLTERQTSAFKDLIVTFETDPKLFKVEGETLLQRVDSVRSTPWGGSTDFEAAMKLVLNHAIRNNVSAEEMPDYLICCSDMEFNMAGRSTQTNFEVVKEMYSNAGYEMPKLIFWQLNGRANNIQATANTENVAMVSGFSPAIMQAVLSCNMPTPRSIMEAAVMVPRYDVQGVTV